MPNTREDTDLNLIEFQLTQGASKLIDSASFTPFPLILRAKVEDGRTGNLVKAC